MSYAEHFAWMNSHYLHKCLGCEGSYCSHFAEEETLVQRSEGTCLRSPSLELVVFRPQSQDHLNRLRMQDPPGSLSRTQKSVVGWTPLAPDALGAGVTLGPIPYWG